MKRSAPGVVQNFTSLVLSDSHKRRESRLASQPLGPLLSLYNAALDHMISRALDPRLCDLQWPPPEFAPPFKFSAGSGLPPLHWNSLPYMESIRHALSRLSMPREFGGGGGVRAAEEGGGEWEWSGEWSRQCAECQRFLAALPTSERDGDQSKILLFSRYA